MSKFDKAYEDKEKNKQLGAIDKLIPQEEVVVVEENEVEDVVKNEQGLTGKDKDLAEFLKKQEKKKAQTVESTHKRTTVLFEKDLMIKLDKMARDKEGDIIRGYKTHFFNEAIREKMARIEENDK